ncbi:MAG: ABC-type transporter, integral rane subunit [Acidimicrobiales bacterium]|nr:ABC-type transporter, integral rane subunit [Acidimicrobiales bacterium]
MTRLLVDPFREPYMQRALIEILVLSALAGVVSVYVLLRRLAFVGDAMTHTIFPGVAIAFVAGQSLFVGALAFGLLSAVLLTAATRIPRVDPDAALGVLLGAFFSVGVIVVSTTHSYTADLTALLFGRILNVDTREIVDTALIAVLVLGVLAVTHKELVFRAFDPIGAEALGYRAAVLDLVVNALVALVVVAAVRAVGTVLVIALIVVPGATARLVTERVRSMMVVSVAVSALCGYVGLAASYEASLHHGVRLGSGATIVIALTVAFTAVAGASVLRRRHSRRVHEEPSVAVVA